MPLRHLSEDFGQEASLVHLACAGRFEQEMGKGKAEGVNGPDVWTTIAYLRVLRCDIQIGTRCTHCLSALLRFFVQDVAVALHDKVTCQHSFGRSCGDLGGTTTML